MADRAEGMQEGRVRRAALVGLLGPGAAVLAGAAPAVSFKVVPSQALYPAEIELQIRQGAQIGVKTLPVIVQQQLGPAVVQLAGAARQ